MGTQEAGSPCYKRDGTLPFLDRRPPFSRRNRGHPGSSFASGFGRHEVNVIVDFRLPIANWIFGFGVWDFAKNSL
jgi:hypothetical protein